MVLALGVVRRVALLLFACSSDAAPSVSFPINSQVPPVARVSKPFSFVFSQSTFSSDSAIFYSLSRAPKWLALDGAARRLYGTPTEREVPPGDVVGVPIRLVATDKSGSTTLDATLVVSRKPGPDVQTPAEEQVPSFGPFSHPSSTLSYPEKPFRFTFSRDTFSRSDLNYYATMRDNTPLPSWVSFDPGTLAFVGTTPPFNTLIQPPQTFELQLVASDIIGFSATSITFSVVVGIHQMVAGEYSLALNATIGTLLSDRSLKDKVKIDGRAAKPEDITAASTPNIPPWLAFDKTSWEFRGTPTAGSQSTSFPLILQDEFNDVLNLTVDVNIGTSVFRDSFKELSFRAGSQLRVDLKPYLWKPSDARVTIATEPISEWISYDPAAMSLSGEVPVAAAGSEVLVSITARSKSSGEVDERKLKIRVLSPVIDATTSAISDPAAKPSDVANNTTQPTGSLSGDGGSKAPRLGVVLPAVLLPILLLCVVILAAFICCRRRRRRRPRHLESRDISGPIPGSFIFNGANDANSSLLELSKHFDIGNVSPTKSSQEGRTRSGQGGDDGLLLAPASVENPFSDKAGTKGWSSAKATLFAGRKVRKTRSKSYLSDTSVFDDPRNMVNLSGPFQPKTTSRSFRDDVEVDIPSLSELSDPDSIQHTPDFAYHGHRTSSSLGARGLDGERASSSTPPAGATLVKPPPVARPQTRTRQLGTRPDSKQGSRTLEGKKAMTLDTAKEKSSFENVDTFEEKKKTRAIWRQRSPEKKEVSILNRPRPAALSIRQPSSLPVSRRGQGSDGTNSLRGSSRFRDLPHFKEGLNSQRVSDASRVGSDSGQNDSSPGTSKGDNALGISYQLREAEVSPISPFSPSKSWYTVWSEDEDKAPADDGQTLPSPAAPNWTVLSPDGRVADESPVINDWVAGASSSGLGGRQRVGGGREREPLRESPPPPPLPAKDAKRASRYSVLNDDAHSGAGGEKPATEGGKASGWGQGLLGPPPVDERRIGSDGSLGKGEKGQKGALQLSYNATSG